MAPNQFMVTLAAALFPWGALAQSSTEISYGGLVASDYISDGESLSNGKPVLQGYVTVQHGLIYAGVWASTLDDGTDHLEAELYFGIQGDLGELEWDLGFARTFYDKSGACCNEVALYAEHPVADNFSAFGSISHDFELLEASAGVLGDFDLDDAWSVSGFLAADFVEDEQSEFSWDMGLTRMLGENAWADLRYSDATDEAAHVILSLGADF